MSFAASVMLKDAEVPFEVLILSFLHLPLCYKAQLYIYGLWITLAWTQVVFQLLIIF